MTSNNNSNSPTTRIQHDISNDDGLAVDLIAFAVVLLSLMGFLTLIRANGTGQNDGEQDTVAIAVVWLVSTIISCVLCEGEHLYRMGRVQVLVWLALAIYFLALDENYDSQVVAAVGIITGIVLMSFGIYAKDDNYHMISSGRLGGKHHQYELAIVEEKPRRGGDKEDTTSVTEEYIDADGGDII